MWSESVGDIWVEGGLLVGVEGICVEKRVLVGEGCWDCFWECKLCLEDWEYKFDGL